MKQPNIVVIMCDQLRADALGCYGNTFVKTPHIDRIAAEGITFSQAYSRTPVCVPARHGLLSGKAPFQLGLTENGSMNGPVTHPLPAEMRKLGYFTCAVGKMHFTPPRNHYGFDRMYLSEELPDHFGDDDYLAFLRDNGYGHVIEPHGRRSEQYYVPHVSSLPEELHATAWTATKTVEVIRTNRHRPFFVFTSFIKPHPPFDPCEPYHKMYDPADVPKPVRRESELSPIDLAIDVQNDYKVNGIGQVDDQKVREMRAAYYGCISQIDKQVGRILDELERLSLMDNTLIIFTSDHGEMLGDHYAYGKRTYYEASTRIPLLLRGAGAQSGRRSHALTSLEDIYATCITTGGGQPQADSMGQDLQGLTSGLVIERKELYGEYGRGRSLKLMRRWGDYKYIYHANGAREALFHLAEDPDELNNLANTEKSLCTESRIKMVDYYKAYGFTEALNENRLVCYEHSPHKPTGFLNQYPKWPDDAPPDSKGSDAWGPLSGLS